MKLAASTFKKSISRKFFDAILWVSGYQLARPAWLVLESTNQCNLHCPICGADYDRQQYAIGNMPWEIFIGLADQARDLKPAAVSLHARGEPLLHPQLDLMIKALKERGLTTHLATNGVRLDRSTARRLADAGLDQLVISLPAVSADNYQACRGQRLTREYEARLMEAIDVWAQSGRQLVIQSLVLPALCRDGAELLGTFIDKWLSQPGVGMIEFNGYQPWPRHFREDLIRGLFQRPFICNVALDGLTVFWNAAITPCSYDTLGDLAVGRWPDLTLQGAYNCSTIRSIRRRNRRLSATRSPLCRRCLLSRSTAPSTMVRSEELRQRQGKERQRHISRLASSHWRALTR